jgi:Fur family transcriptional regulator, ferric uptake regulator
MREKSSGARLIEQAGMEPTANRLLVYDQIATQDHAVSAPELLEQLSGKSTMNRVTLYRILDLFVEHGIVQRHSVGDRAFRYCLGEKAGLKGHCHFFCTSCGRTECVAFSQLSIDPERIQRDTGGHVQHMEVRLDGLCRNCRHG